MMTDSALTFSARQSLGNVQPTPSISTREFTLLPGVSETLKIVGTSVYVAQCYTIDGEGYQLPAAVKISLGASQPFLSETGTTVEFKYYGTPFNEITIEGVGTEKIYLTLQVGYMLECRKGDAGTAGAIATLREKIEENKKEIERLIEELEAIGPATATTYGLVKYVDDQIVTNLSGTAAVRRTDAGKMVVLSGTTSRPGVYTLGTATQVENTAGMVGKTASGALAVRFASQTASGVVFLANGTNDGRARAVFTVAQVNEIVSGLTSRIDELENKLANLSTAAPFVLSKSVSANATAILMPIDAELNGEVSVETNADWISADSDGNILIEENS